MLDAQAQQQQQMRSIEKGRCCFRKSGKIVVFLGVMQTKRYKLKRKKNVHNSFVVVEEDTAQQCMKETTRRKEEIRQILARSYQIKLKHNIARAWPN